MDHHQLGFGPEAHIKHARVNCRGYYDKGLISFILTLNVLPRKAFKHDHSYTEAANFAKQNLSLPILWAMAQYPRLTWRFYRCLLQITEWYHACFISLKSII